MINISEEKEGSGRVGVGGVGGTSGPQGILMKGIQ